MTEPRAFTKEEARQQFLHQVRAMVKYWSYMREKNPECESEEGMAFSILNILDGSTSFCAVDLVLRPNPKDKQYCVENGENWIEDGMVINDDCQLHELYYRR